MSENKTIIPGMEGSQSFNGRGFYSRDNSPAGNSYGRTIVPGMDVAATGNNQGVVSATQDVTSANVPVVGFLYSISRQGIGEYWPLHIGRNTIGRSENNDICLREATVSDVHASLNIKQMKTTHKILASIRDEGSKNGIFVNEEELDYGVHECKNHDKILIGDNYTLLLILIDSEAFGLEVAPNFKIVDAPINRSGIDNDTSAMYSSHEKPTGGTMSMNGANPEYGKTKFL